MLFANVIKLAKMRNIVYYFYKCNKIGKNEEYSLLFLHFLLLHLRQSLDAVIFREVINVGVGSSIQQCTWGARV